MATFHSGHGASWRQNKGHLSIQPGLFSRYLFFSFPSLPWKTIGFFQCGVSPVWGYHQEYCSNSCLHLSCLKLFFHPLRKKRTEQSQDGPATCRHLNQFLMCSVTTVHFLPRSHLHHSFFRLVGCHDVIHPHSHCHFSGLVHVRFQGTVRVKHWSLYLRGQPATVGEDALLCMQLPLDVSSPSVLEKEAVKHDSQWLVAEDGKWSLILLVSKQGLI